LLSGRDIPFGTTNGPSGTPTQVICINF